SREGRGGYSGRSGRGSLDLPARRGPPGVAEKIGARPELVETLRAERQTSRRTRHFSIPAGRRPAAPPPSRTSQPRLAKAPPILPFSSPFMGRGTAEGGGGALRDTTNRPPPSRPLRVRSTSP